MALISEQEINNIRNGADIVDIINDYVPLSKSGNDYVGVCPFHDDHSPSMRVSPKLGIFKCFVCNSGGNVFSFVQKYENVSYPEAIKIVAEKSGIAFNHDISNTFVSKNKKEFDIMDLSLKYFQNNLASASGIEAKKYLHDRGITDNIIKEFKLGLAPSSNNLTSFLENKKIDLETCFNIGLLNKDGINYYDTFINRILIPIFDINGNLAGYTGRIYNSESKNKYINSKESIIYHKSNILFNYFNAKNDIRLLKEIVIVEGNMDAITMASHGIKNVCALMGVVISKYQIEAIKKLHSKVVLMLDNDNAGFTGSLNVGKELYDIGVDVYIASIKGAKDPDEFINKYGPEKLKDAIKYAVKYLDFEINTLKSKYDMNNPKDLANYINEVLKTLNNASDLEKELTINKICKEYDIDPDIIKKTISYDKPKELVNTSAVKIKKDKYILASEEMIHAMLFNKDFYEIYIDKLGYLINKVERDTVALIGSFIKKNNDIDISSFIDYVINRAEVSMYVNKLISSDYNESMSKEEFINLVKVVSKCIDEIEIKELKQKIKQEQDVNVKLELMEKLTELKKEVE